MVCERAPKRCLLQGCFGVRAVPRRNNNHNHNHNHNHNNNNNNNNNRGLCPGIAGFAKPLNKKSGAATRHLCQSILNRMACGVAFALAIWGRALSLRSPLNFPLFWFAITACKACHQLLTPSKPTSCSFKSFFMTAKKNVLTFTSSRAFYMDDGAMLLELDNTVGHRYSHNENTKLIVLAFLLHIDMLSCSTHTILIIYIKVQKRDRCA